MRAVIAGVLVAGCGAAPPAAPPGPARAPADVLAEGGAGGCPAGWNRFADRHEPPRFSLCAPHGARIGWTSSPDELAGTVDDARFAPDDSAVLTVVAMVRARPEGLGPVPPSPGARIDFDRSDRFAGRDARHFRMHFHDHRERSLDLDEHGDHVGGEASDHDATVEAWGMALGAGTLQVAVHTQDNTAPGTERLLQQIASTLVVETR